MSGSPLLAAAALAIGIAVAGSGALPAAPAALLAAGLGLWIALRIRSAVPALAAGWLVLGLFVADAGSGAPGAALAELAEDGRVEGLEGVVVGAVELAPRRRRAHAKTAFGTAELRYRPPLELSPGDRVVLAGALYLPKPPPGPGLGDPRRRLAAGGARFYIDVESAIPVASEASIWRLAHCLRRAAIAAIERRGGDPSGRGIVRALVAGDRGGIGEKDAAAFRAAGVAHLLAVSGLHLAVVLGLCVVLFRFLWAISPVKHRFCPRRAAALLAMPVALLFAAVTGARPSTLRALLVALAVLFAVAAERPLRLLDGLALAAVVLLIANPAELWDPGFQLSFAAALALAAAARAARSPDLSPADRPRLVRATLGLAEATLWATAATAPIAAWWFHELASAALLGNLLAAPVVELVVLPVALLGTLAEAAGAGGFLLDVAIALAGAVAELAAAVGAAIPPRNVFPPSVPELCLWYAMLAALLAGRRRGRHRKLALGAALVLLLAAAGARFASGSGAGSELKLTVFDVGQGSAALVETPSGAAWLLDAGGLPYVAADHPDPLALGALPGRRVIAPGLRAKKISELELVVLSHPHPDHFRGLGALVDSVPIAELWIPRPDERPWPRELRDILDQLRRRGTRIVHPLLDVTAERDGVAVTVLGPRHRGARAAADPVMSANDASLVLRIDYAGRRILAPGDIELEGEEALRGRDIAADVVLVPHHGSPSSSSADFVRATRASIAVVSCGTGNRFGFPAASVVDRWREEGAAVFRSDRDGGVRVTVGVGGGISVGGF